MHRLIKIPLVFSLASLFFSCVNSKKLNISWVYNKQVVYEGKMDGNGHKIILRDSITTPCIAKITRLDSILSLTIFEGDYKTDTLQKDAKGNIYQGVFFPYMDSANKGTSMFSSSKKLKYLETGPVFQALTIPLKVRLAQDGHPYEAEGSINFGVAFGWKFTHHEYQNFYHRKTGLFVNSESNRYSITPGIFIGPGVVELTTRNSQVANDRNVLSFSYGTMLVFGLNRLNIGVALGFDNAVGNQDQNWIYQGKPWLGATISFDLIQ